MSGKIVFTMAMSIDGYIADIDGGFGWIAGDGDRSLNTRKQWDYPLFLKDIDIVVMGKNCYEQKLYEEFSQKTLFVATSSPRSDYDNIHFIHGDIIEQVMAQKQKYGKNIFIFGGGILADTFIKADVIDQYIIGVIPVILGNGRPLFAENTPTIRLKLDNYSIDEGVTVLYYSRR